MKAIILRENGGVEKLIYQDIAMPDIKPDEVLVKVNAISINPVDAAVRQYMQVMEKIMQLQEEQDYYVPGWDISGTVVSTGAKVTELQNRDVFGMVNFPGQGKAYAEYVAAPAAHLAFKPPHISHAEAAGATLAALTAFQALVTYGKIKEGEHVVIHGASGGVGHFAVQIARAYGAHVTGIASGRNKDFVLSLGAGKFIDYTHDGSLEELNDADVVLDSINSGESLKRSIQILKRGGRLVSIKAYFDEETATLARAKDLYFERILVSSNGKDMGHIAQMLEDGRVKTHVSKVFPFEKMAQAHTEIESGRTRGKIVVEMGGK